MKIKLFLGAIVLSLLLAGDTAYGQQGPQTFKITDETFLLNGKPFVIRCGEMHFARIPKEYWRHRLKMAKAMGLNTVCAYLFWNFVEKTPGHFDWSGQADAATFCKMAQEEGLYVLLRPGPYSCAEWEMGGQPWWLLKKKDIKLRTQDPYYLEKSKAYLKEVGKELAPLEITKGGPILMVQVENEYGSYGSDKVYVGKIRDYLAEAGFDGPFFTCDGTVQLKNDVRDDIFATVNFGNNPEAGFKALREVRSKGPLMCSEYYPGWFDSWGAPHHTGTSEKVVKEIAYMLDHKASFSIYMVHGGTTFGLWAGANCPPYLPETSSYDYDAPISENGLATPKYYDLRNMLKKYLLPGEDMPEVPAAIPVQTIKPFTCTQSALVMPQLKNPVESDTTLYFEDLDLGYGALLYETTLPASSAAVLDVTEVHDYALVYLDDKLIGKLDRRKSEHLVSLPDRKKDARLRIFVEAMGRVNYGELMHDRKGLQGEVYLVQGSQRKQLSGWKHYAVPLGEGNPAYTYSVSSIKQSNSASEQPCFYKGTFTTNSSADFFLDMKNFGKGVVWVNGRCMGRYWHIGPTQTMYVPGVWLKKGENEVVVLDLLKPKSLVLQGLDKPVLDSMTTNTLTGHRQKGESFKDNSSFMVYKGTLTNSPDWQLIKLPGLKSGRYFALESLDNFNGDAFTTIAEIELLDKNGKEISRKNWKVIYADSEEVNAQDGKADNVFDLQYTSYWHTQWRDAQPKHPHQIVIDLGKSETISEVKLLPRQDNPNGRIKDVKLYLGDKKFNGLK